MFGPIYNITTNNNDDNNISIIITNANIYNPTNIFNDDIWFRPPDGQAAVIVLMFNELIMTESLMTEIE